VTEHCAAEIIKTSWPLRRIATEIRVSLAVESAKPCILSLQTCLKYWRHVILFVLANSTPPENALVEGWGACAMPEPAARVRWLPVRRPPVRRPPRPLKRFSRS